MKNLLKWSVLLLFFTSTAFSHAAEIYVDINASGSNDGQSWTNAFTDLQDALAVAGNGDEIWVSNGVYKPTTTTDRDISFNIPDGVELYGGFAGGETNRADRDWQTNASIISGAIGSQVDVTDNTKRLILINNADDVVIAGFKIQRAYNESFETISVYNSSNVRFRQCDIRINYSDGYAFYFQFSAVEFKDCLFRDNDSFAAVMSAANETELSILNCTFAQNSGFNLIWSSGDASDVSLLNSIVAENTFSGNIITSGNSSQAQNCIITSPNLGFSSTTNINSDDPLFEDPATNNFRLLSGSPAIGFGNTSFTSQGLDLAHEFRISGADVDAGCYERDVATRWYVDEDASGLDNGTSWTNAFNDLQDALAVAEAGDQVWVAEGEYFVSGTDNEFNELVIGNDVSMFGGFEADETARNQRNWELHETVVNGELGDPADDSDNTQVMIRFVGGTNVSVVDGFTFENAHSDLAPNFISNGATC
ncbi:MAG: right-handed parallel beta-helix repeat-containing protein [Flavobacteriales bacterium]|nr:right-handed parallel beta-helix repeat-containing protein [Flavobacteriales bacterium]